VSKVQLVLPGRFDSIPSICDCVVEAAEAAGLDTTDVFHVQLAVDEACTNVVEHAYGGEEQGDIHFCCEIDPIREWFVVRIRDNGKPFDPDSIPEPNLTHDLADLQVGGLGMYFMRKIMDRVEFRFQDGWNEVVMYKQLGDEGITNPPGPVWQRDLPEGVKLLGVRGRLDHHLVPYLESTLTDLIEAGNVRLVVDFGEATYINSGGLRTLVSAWRTAQKQQGNVHLSGLDQRLTEIFEMVGFQQIFNIFPDPAAAADAFLLTE